jgi:hypothetical protein
MKGTAEASNPQVGGRIRSSDCEEDRTLRAALIEMLREAERS